MLIDIHTHHPKNRGAVEIVIGFDTAGIHPWQLKNDSVLADHLYNLKVMRSQHRGPVMVGECGLDRRKKELLPISDQIILFESHLDWAHELNIPLVLHCVGASSDLLEILKRRRYQGKILWHDFRGNIQLVRALNKFEFYYSFGSYLLNNPTSAKELIKAIGLSKIFLETDDNAGLNLESLHEDLAKILSIKSDVLESRIESNFRHLFSYRDDISPSDFINQHRLSVST